MALTLTHPFVSTIPDGSDATLVRPSNWNANHTVTGTLDVANGGTGVTTSTGSGANVLSTSPTLVTPTLSGNTTVTSGSFGLSGNITAPAWTTAGIRYANVTATLTDTTSTGTVATAYTDVFGGNTIAASSATTFTNYATARFSDPVAGTNVTITNPFSISAGKVSFTNLNATTGAFGGATIGSDALAVTGTATISSTLNAQGNLDMTNTTISRITSARFGASSDVILTRGGAAATLQLGNVDAASPVAQTLQVQSVVAGTTNTAGVDWSFYGSKGTGTGAGGSLKFYTSPAGSTGTAQNAGVLAMTIAADKSAAFTGNVSATGNIQGSNLIAGSTFLVGWISRALLYSPVDSALRISNNAGTSTTDLTVSGASTTGGSLLTLGGGLTANGTIAATGNFQTTGGFVYAGRGGFTMSADGVAELYNNAGTDFGRLQFGGTTSSFPALKRNTTSLSVVLADDSAYASLAAKDITTYNATFLHSTGIALTAGATGNAPTLTAGPVTGNPTKWIAISDNGTTRYIPAW